MTSKDAIKRQRMRRHRLVSAPFASATDVVDHFGAVQAQEFQWAFWGVGQRTARTTLADLEQLFNDGAILRTHVLRPTWHFVRPADIRWFLQLTGPRVHAANAYYYRRLELEDALFARSEELLTQALTGGKTLTRTELAGELERGGITASGQRLAYIAMHAELDGIICSGPRRGKQHTYIRLEDRVPPAPNLDRDDALKRLTERFFSGHGPATAPDFAWWSGLTLADVKRGIASLGNCLRAIDLDSVTYWDISDLAGDVGESSDKPVAVHLLPVYDEYLIAYKDRALVFAPAFQNSLDSEGEEIQAHIMLVDGLVSGGWRREITSEGVVISLRYLKGVSKIDPHLFASALDRYSRFLELPVVVS